MIRNIIPKIVDVIHQKVIVNILPPSLYLFLHRHLRKFFYNIQIKSRVDDYTVLLADYPRCGIGWLRFVIATVLHYQCAGEFRKLSPWEMYKYTPTLADKGSYAPFYFNGRYSLLKTHLGHTPQFKRGVIIYRNPFDAIKSFYAHKLMEEGEVVCVTTRDINKEESFLLREIREYINFYETWMKQIILYPQNYLLIKYEDLLINTAGLFETIFKFLMIDITNLPQGGLNTLAEMYKRTDVSTPLIGKRDLKEAVDIKLNIFNRLENVFTSDNLFRLDSCLGKQVDSVISRLDTLRCKP